MEAQKLDVATSATSTQANPNRMSARLENLAPTILIWPAVLVVLFLSIFPLFVSFYLSLARYDILSNSVIFMGFRNYERLLFGSEQRRFLGRFSDTPAPIGVVLTLILVAVMLVMLIQYIRRQELPMIGQFGRLALAAGLGAVAWGVVWLLVRDVEAGTWFTGKYWLLTFIPGLTVMISSLVLSIFGLLMRLFVIVFSTALAWLASITLGEGGLPGTLMVTLIFVVVGVSVQYFIGLGLALIVTQNLPGKRFFRVIFLLPMMITPVGIGFLFRMMTDTTKGPFAPLWIAAGLTDFSWVETGTGARTAILIGDIWQWTPFMFIILLAALEGVSTEPIEAALVDGANRWQLFRHIIIPELVPVSTTLILIRMIEAFKIIDLPNIMTGGGPGTATESVTLHSYNGWRALDLGASAALAYMLLFVVTFFALVFVNIVRRRLVEIL